MEKGGKKQHGQDKETPHAVQYRQGAAASTVRRAPLVFFPLLLENTRTHTRKLALSGSAFFSLLLVPTILSLPCSVALSILSPVQPAAAVPPSPSGVSSCRSKLEFGPSSPHHQSGKSLSPENYPSQIIMGRERLYSSSPFALLSPKGRSFCVLPHKYLEPYLLFCLAMG